MKKTFLLILFSTIISIQGCGYFEPEETIIGSNVVIESSTIERIKTPHLLKRTKNSAAVNFYPTTKWHNHEGSIQLESGELITLKVAIITIDNEKIYTEAYGQAGNAFYGDFSDLSKKTKIKEIFVESSQTIKFEKISWYCYNPI